MVSKKYSAPGTLMGLSTDKPFRGKSVIFHIDNEIHLEVDLDHASPTEKTEAGILPGIEQSIFFKDHLRVEYPEEVEGHIEIFVAE